MTLRPEARFIGGKDLDVLHEKALADWIKHANDAASEVAGYDELYARYVTTISDKGTFAASKGYDAYGVLYDDGTEFVVVLNRSAVRIQEELMDSDIYRTLAREYGYGE